MTLRVNHRNVLEGSLSGLKKVTGHPMFYAIILITVTGVRGRFSSLRVFKDKDSLSVYSLCPCVPQTALVSLPKHKCKVTRQQEQPFLTLYPKKDV